MKGVWMGAAAVLLAVPALAQNAPSAAPQAAPIVDGHRVAPRPVAPPKNANGDDAAKLLAMTPDTDPPVQPHDIYGTPLGDAPPPEQPK